MRLGRKLSQHFSDEPQHRGCVPSTDSSMCSTSRGSNNMRGEGEEKEEERGEEREWRGERRSERREGDEK